MGGFIEDVWGEITREAGDVWSIITGQQSVGDVLSERYGGGTRGPDLPSGYYPMVPMTRAETERRSAARELYGAYGPGQLMTLPTGEQIYIRPGGRRRMNVLNPRALSRSIRRVKGFMKFARRVGSFAAPGRSYHMKAFGHRVSHKVKHR